MTTVKEALQEVFVTFSAMDLDKELKEDKYYASVFETEVQKVFTKVAKEVLGEHYQHLLPVARVQVSGALNYPKKLLKSTLISRMGRINVELTRSPLHVSNLPYLTSDMKGSLQEVLDLEVDNLEQELVLRQQLNEHSYVEHAKYMVRKVSQELEERSRKSLVAIDKQHKDLFDMKNFDHRLARSAFEGVLFDMEEGL